MTENYTIEIYGKPIPWSSPFVGKNYTYSKHAPYKGSVQWQMQQQFKYEPIETPVKVEFIFKFIPPNNISKKRLPLYFNNSIQYTKTPDLTNLIKFIEDCGNSVLWKDDRLIYEHTAIKKYSQKEMTVLRIYKQPMEN